MTRVQPTAAARPAPRKERRRGTTLAAFVLGIPLAVAILSFIRFGPPRETVAVRYVKHPAEQIEVVMFCMALGALTAKLLALRAERRAWTRPDARLPPCPRPQISQPSDELRTRPPGRASR